MNLRVLVILAQLLLIPSSKAEDSPMLHLPPDAFWIKNHWQSPSDINPPKQWRTPLELSPAQKSKISTKGLANLFISGSASPSLNNLLWLKKNYGAKHPIYLIDLRQETHLYVDGLAISIFLKRDEINWGKSPTRIKSEEQAWIKYLNQVKSLSINSLSKPINGFKTGIDPITLPIKQSYSEAQAAVKAKLNYLRIEVPDYYPPTPQQVDFFLHFFQHLPANAWLHFHCAGGKGRTTTFMAMVDILHNGKTQSLAEITKRQALLGGIDLLGTSPSLSAQAWKKDSHQAREEFISLFYHYVLDAYPKESFSAWLTQQKQGTYSANLRTRAYYTRANL